MVSYLGGYLLKGDREETQRRGCVRGDWKGKGAMILQLINEKQKKKKQADWCIKIYRYRNVRNKHL